MVNVSFKTSHMLSMTIQMPEYLIVYYSNGSEIQKAFIQILTLYFI